MTFTRKVALVAIVASVAGGSAFSSPVKARRVRLTPLATGVAPPGNDNCTSATAVNSTPFTQALSNSEATDESGEPPSSCTAQGLSVWYSFTNTSAIVNSFTVDTIGSDFDTALMVYEGGACGAFGTIAGCDDDGFGDGFQSSVTVNAQPFTTYLIQAGGFDGSFGNMVVNVTSQIPVPSMTGWAFTALLFALASVGTMFIARRRVQFAA